MISMPETRYAKSGDTYIAYQIMGNGPIDLVLVPGYLTHLDMQFEQPLYASFVTQLATFCRLIRFDKRGTGLSDRLSAIPTLEERMDDVRAVMDSAGSTRAALLGYSEGGPMSIVFAATYPRTDLSANFVCLIRAACLGARQSLGHDGRAASGGAQIARGDLGPRQSNRPVHAKPGR